MIVKPYKTASMEIKVVDFSGISTGADVSSTVVDQLHEAFSTIGFVIITNHGIEEKVSIGYTIYGLSGWAMLRAKVLDLLLSVNKS